MINNINEVFQCFNSVHEKVKFTIEHEEDNSLAFLDVKIFKLSKNIDTTVYRNEKRPTLEYTQDGKTTYGSGTNKIWSGPYYMAYSICSNQELRTIKTFTI